jgi:excisionase family DNA binding protein
MDEANLSQLLFISVPEAARRLGISRSLAYELANRWLSGNSEGGLPSIRLGRRLLVSRSAIESMAGVTWQCL